MATLTRRTQLLLDENRYERLAERARQSGTSVAELIRKAIDEAYPTVTERRRQAAEHFLAAESVGPTLGDLNELKREINEMYERSLPGDGV